MVASDVDAGPSQPRLLTTHGLVGFGVDADFTYGEQGDVSDMTPPPPWSRPMLTPVAAVAYDVDAGPSQPRPSPTHSLVD